MQPKCGMLNLKEHFLQELQTSNYEYHGHENWRAKETLEEKLEILFGRSLNWWTLENRLADRNR